ncbi:MAG: type VI secretion system baseplate subunit TssG, partial [Desulfohalobiaceae bacterium]
VETLMPDPSKVSTITGLMFALTGLTAAISSINLGKLFENRPNLIILIVSLIASGVFFFAQALGHESLREQFEETYQALRYAGLYTQHPRSALGLQTLLSDRLGGIPVQIKQCQPQKLSVPEDQLLCLGQQGHALGENTVLGCQIVEHMNKIGIEVGPLDAEQFQSLMPGSSLHKAIEEHVSLFCIQTLAYDLTLLIGRGEKQTTTLGAGRWSSLGWQTWLFSGPSQAPGAVTFTKN